MSLEEFKRLPDVNIWKQAHTVWVVYPEQKQVYVMSRSGEDRVLSAGEVLDAPDLLPGFSVAVESLFE